MKYILNVDTESMESVPHPSENPFAHLPVELVSMTQVHTALLCTPRPFC